MAELKPMTDEDRTAVADAVARADHFLVSLFLGRGQYEKLPPLPSLDMARRASVLLEQIHPNGRAAMVYAVTTTGRNVFVPPSFTDGEST